MAARGLRFGLLGPLQIIVGGSPLALGSPKQRAVLAALLVNRNRPVGIESLTNAAWEDARPARADANIHTYVSNLRRLLSNAGIDPRSVLVNSAPGYRLDVGDDGVDLGLFITAKTAGVHAAAMGQFEETSRHLSAALSEWRGPVLQDLCEFQFVEAFAIGLAEEKVVVQTARAEAEIACGRADAVIGELEVLTGEHPYREPLWAQLITAYYLAGRQSDALDTYRRLKSTLADDLGIDPSEPLRTLHQRILRQESLDVKRAAQSTAAKTIIAIDRRTATHARSAVARLRDTSGRCYVLRAAATRIGRRADNDIVLADPKVSRHHAVIIDTGTSYQITDLQSANGLEVQHQRIRTSATLEDGDQIRIGVNNFTFEIFSEAAPPATS
jgi:SARP family transcriptional regulator, regulator of embCAB operon